MHPRAHPLETVLGIETSCDDTACAVLARDGRVLSSVVSSQLAAHRPFGGVVPEIASREHLVNWPSVSAEALARAGIALAEVGSVAATRGPGLIGALLVGLSLGRSIAWSLGRPFHAVHHLEGHLYSPFLRADGRPAAEVPELFDALVVSGGHSSIFHVDRGRVETVAETRDDAMGEVFDKVGKRLGLPYPQGPLVDRLAEAGDPAAQPLAVATCSDGSLDFSFSGLKSQAILAIEKLERSGVRWPDGATRAEEAPAALLDLLAGFRAAAVGQVLDRLTRLHRDRPVELLAVSGGVAANRLLRRELVVWAEEQGVDLRLVELTHSGDNAAMIAWAAILRERRGLSDDPLEVDAASRVAI
ncbi:MAG: tRNA (adenosine(37)-N6)-threonylcarbamoyltransferase complex transferase subunit TsaD [Thermoanaerobaculia bacterium]|nr:tRNA (adenosine(37)-N6)-threonylcarbamoyltransferase complex transferase subunit TsaD [Thermoanaerobaculia bacterium]